MNFLNPLFLAGIAALAVPLLIHIINLRRPQSIPFSTLAFFEELKQSTIRRIRIKRYLLLLLRCAAIILLALALARPFIPTNLLGDVSSGESRAVGILIDNSPSMDQIDQQGPFIEQSRQTAVEFVEKARDKDQYIIQKTNGEPLNMSVLSDASAKQKLEQLDVEQKGSYLVERLRGMRQELQKSGQGPKVIYVFSDMQKSQWSRLQQSDFSNKQGDSEFTEIQLVKVGSELQSNVSISDISLENQMLSRDKPVSIRVKIQNYSKKPVANQFISLQMNGEMVGQFETDLKGNSSKEFSYEYVPEETGQIRGKAILEGDPVSFDNERYFMLEIPRKRSALLVQEAEQDDEFSSYLPNTFQAAEKTGSQLSYEQINLQDLSAEDLKGTDVLIFDGVNQIPSYLFTDLQEYVQEGHGIVFLPSEKGEVQNYNTFLNQFNAGQFGGLRGEYGRFKSVSRLAKITEGHPVINKMFNKRKREKIRVNRPEIFFNYQYENMRNSNAIKVLQTTINDPLLVEHSFGDGKLMVSTIGADPGWSNFPVNSLFAPVFYRTILYAATSEKGGLTAYNLGTPFTWTGPLPEPVATLTKQEQTVKPELTQEADGYRVSYSGMDWTPGWLMLESGTFQHLFALNLQEAESRFETLNPHSIDSLLGDQIKIAGFQEMKAPEEAEQIIQSASTGQEIWNWFIWAALILLMTETFISRWYKAESI